MNRLLIIGLILLSSCDPWGCGRDEVPGVYSVYRGKFQEKHVYYVYSINEHNCIEHEEFVYKDVGEDTLEINKISKEVRKRSLGNNLYSNK